MNQKNLTVNILIGALALSACADPMKSEKEPDAGFITSRMDAAAIPEDTGFEMDAAAPTPDAGFEMDAAAMSEDAGFEMDAAAIPEDAGFEMDAASIPEDAGFAMDAAAPAPDAGFAMDASPYFPDTGLASGETFWASNHGGTDFDWGKSLHVDHYHQVHVTGQIRGTVDFGGGNLSSAGDDDIFFAKYDYSGMHQASSLYGNTEHDRGYAITTDNQGNVYLTGVFRNSVNFGGTVLTSSGSSDIFIASYDSSGNHRWSKQMGGPNGDNGWAIIADDQGNIYVGGSFSDRIDLGNGLRLSVGSTDAFVASYDTNGNHRWSKSYGSTAGLEEFRDLALDGQGRLTAIGTFNGTVNFGITSLPSAGNTDVGLAQFLTSTGEPQWVRMYGNTGYDQGDGIAADAAGNIYIAGQFETSIDFGGAMPLSSTDYSNLFVASLDSSANYRWAIDLTGDNNTMGDIAVNPQGWVYAVGDFEQEMVIAGNTAMPLTSINPNRDDAFVISFEGSTGNLRWAKAYGGQNNSEADQVSCGTNGQVYVTGRFTDDMNFGRNIVHNSFGGSWDTFIMSITP